MDSAQAGIHFTLRSLLLAAFSHQTQVWLYTDEYGKKCIRLKDPCAFEIDQVPPPYHLCAARTIGQVIHIMPLFEARP